MKDPIGEGFRLIVVETRRKSYSCCFNSLVFLTVMCQGLYGCSINEYGVVKADMVPGDGSLVYIIKAPGIHFDTREERQPSVSVGLYKAVHVFSTECWSNEQLENRNMDFLFKHLDLQLSVSQVFGAQIKAGPDEVSITLGVRERAELVSLDRSDSMMRTISFVSNRPENTVVFLKGGKKCSVVE